MPPDQAEMRVSFLVKRDDFPVEHGRVRRKPGNRLGKRRETMRETVIVAGPHFDFAVFFNGEGAHAVEFQLE